MVLPEPPLDLNDCAEAEAYRRRLLTTAARSVVRIEADAAAAQRADSPRRGRDAQAEARQAATEPHRHLEDSPALTGLGP